MRIAAIQHRLRESAEADAQALATAGVAAAEGGAELIVFPSVPSLQLDSGAGHLLLSALLRDVPAFCVVPGIDPESRGVAVIAQLPEPFSSSEAASVASVIVGDACMDGATLAEVASHNPSLAVLSPRSENDLQAEAMLEFAIALSDSLAGLVVIAECSGAEPLDVGHGGSAIILLGDVVAEALSDDDVLFAEVPLPLPVPHPREALPQVPPLLVQRFEHHAGRVAIVHGPDIS